MFGNTWLFNQPLSSFDTSKATDMIDMFSSSAFNQPLDHFETSKVKAMTYMFVNGESPTSVSLRFRDKRNPQFKKSSSAKAFNQDISMWRLDAIESMEGMFQNANSFNQCLEDFGDYYHSEVQYSNMFLWTNCGSQSQNTPESSAGPWCNCQGTLHPSLSPTGTPTNVRHPMQWTSLLLGTI